MEYKLLNSEDCFFGNLRHIQAEKQLMLSFNDCSSFLICDSEITLSGYSLSIKDRNKVMHYKVKKSDNGSYCFSQRTILKNIPDLVKHYRQQLGRLG